MLPVIFDEETLLKYAKEHKIQPFRVKQIFMNYSEIKI